jgi:phospholipid/cholesterol/gamma-HCH transport system substrate-binding protein
MDKNAITKGKIAISLVFALSCFGLLLFLWTTFGGPVPLQPKGYQAKILLPEAPLLPVQADIRVSGVPIGKIQKIERSGHNVLATVQIQERYAPLRKDVKVTVRRKTLLGEGYLELTPGHANAPLLPENATIPPSQVRDPVALDQFFSAFDKPTRLALERWLQGWSKGLDGGGQPLNNALGNLSGASESASDLLSELRRQRSAVSTLFRDTGRTFAAIGAHRDRVDALIRNARELFDTTAASDRDVQATFHALPGFLDALRASSAATRRAAVPTTPLLRELRPVARTLPRTLQATDRVAPVLRAIAKPLDRVTAVAPRGLNAASAIVRGSQPLFKAVEPLTRYVVPVLDFAWAYRREITTSWAKTAAATQGTYPDPRTNRPIHYLRSPIVLGVESLNGSKQRAPYSRANAYMAPGGLDEFLKGPLKTLDCGNEKNPIAIPALGGSPPCIEQGPWTFRGKTAQFPLQMIPAP